MKNTIRRAIYKTLSTIDLILGRKTGTFILCYHAIGDDNWRFSISKSMFENQMKYLSMNRQFITLSDVINAIKANQKLPKNSVCITFDDGYKDVLSIAPICKKYGIKPTMFVLGNTKQANEKELGDKRAFLTKKDIEQLKKMGWSIGAHSQTHADFNSMTDKQVGKECKNPNKYKFFAYPKGRYTETIIKAIKQNKFSAGFSMDDEIVSNKSNLFTLPRIGVDRTHSLDEFTTLSSPLCISFRRFVKKYFPSLL